MKKMRKKKQLLQQKIPLLEIKQWSLPTTKKTLVVLRLHLKQTVLKKRRFHPRKVNQMSSNQVLVNISTI